MILRLLVAHGGIVVAVVLAYAVVTAGLRFFLPEYEVERVMERAGWSGRAAGTFGILFLLGVSFGVLTIIYNVLRSV